MDKREISLVIVNNLLSPRFTVAAEKNDIASA